MHQNLKYELKTILENDDFKTAFSKLNEYKNEGGLNTFVTTQNSIFKFSTNGIDHKLIYITKRDALTYSSTDAETINDIYALQSRLHNLIDFGEDLNTRKSTLGFFASGTGLTGLLNPGLLPAYFGASALYIQSIIAKKKCERQILRIHDILYDYDDLLIATGHEIIDYIFPKYE